ncbi:hypothetical protein ID866_11671 [Astraeus odoratus]|nr:hypothetical protein ID866_11671 [Astraeus odoratus]
MLDNFLALVTVVHWATTRTTSSDHIAIIQSAFHSYLTGVVTLYGKDALIPSHHLSLHLPKCLQIFGPVHGWWAFPFERYNGILQKISTNNRIGTCDVVIQG